MKRIDQFWRPKSKAACNLEMQGHMAIIASRSQVLRELFISKMNEPRDEKAKIIIDFE